jgi:hypothetical protein
MGAGAAIEALNHRIRERGQQTTLTGPTLKSLVYNAPAASSTRRILHGGGYTCGQEITMQIKGCGSLPQLKELLEDKDQTLNMLHSVAALSHLATIQCKAVVSVPSDSLASKVLSGID